MGVWLFFGGETVVWMESAHTIIVRCHGVILCKRGRRCFAVRLSRLPLRSLTRWNGAGDCAGQQVSESAGEQGHRGDSTEDGGGRGCGMSTGRLGIPSIQPPW